MKVSLIKETERVTQTKFKTNNQINLVNLE